jgi:hypothetical protein
VLGALGALGVDVAGRRPPVGGLMVRGGRAYAMPSTPGAILTTGLVGAAGKLQGARVFARAALDTFVRVATYANSPRQ